MNKTLFLLRAEQYNANVIETIKARVGRTQRVCYVTLNKTALAVKESLNHESIDYSRYYFVDAVTPRLFKNFMLENCTFIKDISDISKLAEAIITGVKVSMATVVIIDSLSTLATYTGEKQVIAFLAYLESYLVRLRADTILFVVYDDRDQPWVKKIASMCDETVLPKKKSLW